MGPVQPSGAFVPLAPAPNLYAKLTMLSIDDQIVLALRRINQAIDTWSHHLWQEYGLTSPQLAALREILGGQNVSPGKLSTALHISQPVVTGILARLARRGLIPQGALTNRSSEHNRHCDRRGTETGGKSTSFASRSFPKRIGKVTRLATNRDPCGAATCGRNDERARNCRGAVLFPGYEYRRSKGRKTKGNCRGFRFGISDGLTFVLFSKFVKLMFVGSACSSRF